MSYVKLEEVAEGVGQLLPKQQGFAGGTWKIDAWRVLEQTLPKAGFTYHVEKVDQLNECAAFTIPDHRLVVLRQDVYDGLFNDDVFSRSTVVHELAHIVLNHAVTLNRGAPTGGHKFFEDSEWQAKALTAAIMMPLRACREASNEFDLARTCGTSVTAAGYRLQKLRDRNAI